MSSLIGLSSLYYAELTQDDNGGVTYGTPVAVPGLIGANINPNASNETLFGDDGPMDVASTIGAISLELNTADLPLEVQAALLGHSAVSGGILEKKANDVPPFVAIGFKSLKSNGKYRYVWLLKGKFTPHEMDHATKGDRVSFQTPKITGNFVARDNDKKWIRIADEDATGWSSSTATAWFGDPDAT